MSRRNRSRRNRGNRRQRKRGHQFDDEVETARITPRQRFSGSNFPDIREFVDLENEPEPFFYTPHDLQLELEKNPLEPPPLPELFFPECSECQSSEPVVICVCPGSCPLRYVHYDCLVKYMINTQDIPCPGCGNRYTDPHGRIERYLDDPNPMVLFYRMLYDRTMNPRHRNWFIISNLIAILAFFFGFLPHRIQTHTTDEHMMSIIFGSIIASFMIMGNLNRELQDFRRGYPHRMVRFTGLSFTSDGTFILDCSEERPALPGDPGPAFHLIPVNAEGEQIVEHVPED